MDFIASNDGIFAHEYQHAVTYFGAVDSVGDPGYLQVDNWHSAIHEGLSDSAAGLRTEIWTAPGLWPNGACRNNLPFRRIEYPRSTDTKNGAAYVDHYNDRVGAGLGLIPTRPSCRTRLLLAGQGGVHERTTRPAELIPVPGAGNANIGAIMHDAVTDYFRHHPGQLDRRADDDRGREPDPGGSLRPPRATPAAANTSCCGGRFMRWGFSRLTAPTSSKAMAARPACCPGRSHGNTRAPTWAFRPIGGARRTCLSTTDLGWNTTLMWGRKTICSRGAQHRRRGPDQRRGAVLLPRVRDRSAAPFDRVEALPR